MKTPELTQGIALILAGPQGCGKGILARKIAEQYGAALDCNVSRLNSARDLNEILLTRPDVLIVEGLPLRPDQWPPIKSLLTSKKKPVTSLSRVTVVNSPRMIFCTHEAVPEPLRTSRYFTVIDMDARAVA